VEELLKNFEPEMESVTLIPSNGGVFEMTVNGKLLYSKKSTGRHIEPGEGIRLVQKYLREGNK
jgi:selenoprotein W-related protein